MRLNGVMPAYLSNKQNMLCLWGSKEFPYGKAKKPISIPLFVNEKFSKDDGENGVNATAYRSLIESTHGFIKSVFKIHALT